METTYTTQQRSDARQLYAAVGSNPPDRQVITKPRRTGRKAREACLRFCVGSERNESDHQG